MPKEDINQTLYQIFGFENFRDGQKEVIEQLLSDNSALAIFPTGSGKSLCYQLTALHLNHLTIVISPLIALMKDQVDFLTSKGIQAAKFDSTLSLEETKNVWKSIDDNHLKLLYISPERLAGEKFTQRLLRQKISMLVIDEAHCLSEWGHNFRPDYLKIPEYCKILKAERVLALTATATPKVSEDICKAFNIKPEAHINTGYYRPNLTLKMTRCHVTDKLPLLLSRLQNTPNSASIVYVTLQKEAEETADFLIRENLNAVAYHAGLKGELRHNIQEDFMSGKKDIVVATIAFGMGIDKSDVRQVFHLNLPKSMENYAQEIGRAGRDGQESVCEIFASHEDSTVLSNFTYGDTPSRESISKLLHDLLLGDEQFNISVYQASGKYDIRPLVINTLLCYLELEGVIQSTGYFYNTFQFQPLLSSEEILAKFNPERATFLKTIFSQAKKGRVWFSLDLLQLAEATQQEVTRISNALNFLDNQGMIKTQVKDARATYRKLKNDIDISQICYTLSQKFNDSEKRDIQRLQTVVDLSKQKDCLVNSLLNYFGEKREKPCGHCDRCLNIVENYETVKRPKNTLTDEEMAILQQVNLLSHKTLIESRNKAKFLCGINSPSFSRSKPPLSKHDLFGSLIHVPFNLILKLANKS